MGKRPIRPGGKLKIGGVEYVLVAKTELLRLQAASGEADGVARRGVDAASQQQKRLFRARREAGLTQAALARLLGKSQTLVSQAEAGRSRVSDRYVESVMKACGLPPKWGATRTKTRLPTGWDIPREQIAGLDPETFVPVRRGSKRDKQLKRQYVWWGNW
jgi:transcriptional regulator with XRE-family HTH domain